MSLGLDPFRPNLPPAPTFLAQILLSSGAVGFTRPSSSIRLGLLPILATCIYSIIGNANQYMRPRWASLFGGTAFSFLLQYIDLALLSAWDYEAEGPAKDPASAQKPRDAGTGSERGRRSTSADKQSKKDLDSYLRRFYFGWKSMWSYRHLNTSLESRNTPHFSKTDPSYAPSRAVFVAREAAVFAACYLVLDLLGQRPPPKDPQTLFNPAIVPIFSRLGSVTANELKLRVLSCLGFGATLYLVLRGGQAGAGALTVGLGGDEPKDWQLPFGSARDAYTLSKFWG